MLCIRSCLTNPQCHGRSYLFRQGHRDSNLYRIESEVRGGYGDLAVGLKKFPKFIGYLGEQLANP